MKRKIEGLANVADTLNAEEREFLKLARKKFRANVHWFDFEDFAFGMRSPIFARTRSHKNVLEHPLYIALLDMWLDLGEKQGLVTPSKHHKEKHAEGRKSQRRRPAVQERDRAKKRNVETANPSARRRVPKS